MNTRAKTKSKPQLRVANSITSKYRPSIKRVGKNKTLRLNKTTISETNKTLGMAFNRRGRGRPKKMRRNQNQVTVEPVDTNTTDVITVEDPNEDQNEDNLSPPVLTVYTDSELDTPRTETDEQMPVQSTSDGSPATAHLNPGELYSHYLNVSKQLTQRLEAEESGQLNEIGLLKYTLVMAFLGNIEHIFDTIKSDKMLTGVSYDINNKRPDKRVRWADHS